MANFPDRLQHSNIPTFQCSLRHNIWETQSIASLQSKFFQIGYILLNGKFSPTACNIPTFQCSLRHNIWETQSIASLQSRIFQIGYILLNGKFSPTACNIPTFQSSSLPTFQYSSLPTFLNWSWAEPKDHTSNSTILDSKKAPLSFFRRGVGGEALILLSLQCNLFNYHASQFWSGLKALLYY